MLTDHSIFSKSTEELNALEQMLKCRTKAALFIIKTKQIFYYKVTNIPGRDCAVFMLPLLSVKSVKISVNQSNPDLSQPLGEVSCSEGLEIAHFAGGHCHVLPRAAWTVISSSEQVSFSAKCQELSYSCVSCIFFLPFLCCHTNPSKLSPRQPDFKWGNCWNLILSEWSWIIILATQDLRIGTDCFWRVRSKALRWKMGAGAFILQSLLHLALLSTGKQIA